MAASREWLKEKRKLKGYTQQDIEDATGVSRAYYSRIESGLCGNPLNIKTAKAIAECLEFNYLKFYEDDKQQVSA